MSLSDLLKGLKKAGGGNSIIGIDIGTSSLKVVEVERRGKKYVLKNLTWEKLPPELIVGKEIMDRQEVIVKLQEAVKRLGSEVQAAAINVAGQDVIVRKITVPKQKKKEELDESIVWKIREELNVDPADVTWGYFILGDADTAGSLDVFLAAAKPEVVYGLLDLARASGLEPFSVNVDPVALYNTLKYNGYLEEGKTTGVVHIGYESTVLVIIRGGKILLSREMNVSTKTYIESISRFLDLPREVAEEVMYKGPGDKVEEEAFRDTIESLNDRFVGNLERNFQGILPEGETVDKWILSGGGAYITGLADYIKEKFEGEVEILDPFRELEYEAEEGVGDMPAIYSVAIGLAISYFEKETSVNILPEEELEIVEEISIMPHIVLSAVVLIVLLILMGVVSVFQSRKIAKLENEKKTLAEQKVVLQRKAEDIRGIKKQIEEVSGKIEVIKNLSRDRVRYVQIMDEINRLIPYDTWLLGVSEKGADELEIDGETGSNLVLAQFMKRLLSSPLISDVQLIESRVDKANERKVAHFKLSIKLNPVLLAEKGEGRNDKKQGGR